MMKMNKEKFLKTELGSSLQECITAWDKWLERLATGKQLCGVKHSGKYTR